MGDPVVSFENISYTVRKSKYWGLGGFKSKQILDDISGSIQAGELVAIMGPSGAGKSTFLDVLCGRVDKVQNKMSGKVKFFGRKIKKQDFTYVMQEDALEGVLSVRENLQYSALLRLPSDMTRKEKYDRVEEVIEQLGLTKCSDSWIGHKFFRGISGGERRRTSIGMELIVNSPIMFLDEPTSGLDSKTAHNVIQILKGLCNQNRTIICTIHQPSSYVFNLFDKVLFLAGGKAVYFGSVPGAKQFFAENNYHVPELTNPADYYMGILNTDFDMKEEKTARQESIRKLVDSHKVSSAALLDSRQSERAKNAQVNGDRDDDDDYSEGNWFTRLFRDKEPKYQTNIFVQTFHLLTRFALIQTRDPVPFYSRVMQYLMMGALILGTLFLRLPYTTNALYDRIGVIFAIACFIIWFPLSTLEAFLGSKQQFIRERVNGYYSVLPYAVASSMVNVAMSFVFTLCFIIPLYWLVGLNPYAEAFFYTILMTWAIISNAEALISLISSFVPNFITGIALVAFWNLACTLCAGFLIKVSLIPGWWIWVYWSTPFHYSFEGLLNNEFSNNASFYCNNYNSTVSPCACNFPDLDGDCINSGYEVQVFYGVQNVNKWGFYGVVIGFTILYRILYYLVLRFFNTGKK